MPTLEEVISSIQARDELHRRDIRRILQYTDQEVLAGGAGSLEDGRGNITIGSAASIVGANSDDNIAIGRQALIDTDFTDISIAIGGNAQILNAADGAIAIGEGASVDGSFDAIAIGTNATVGTAASQGIAIGEGATVTSGGQLVIGDHIQTAEVQTTDATVTPIATVTVFSSTSKTFTIMVVGFDPVAEETISVFFRGAVRRGAAGAPVIVGTTDELRIEDAGAAPWDVTLTVAGSALTVNVIGEAAHTINWDANIITTIG